MQLDTALNYRSDSLLVQACLAGGQAAWNELVERYQRLVYSIARRYGLSVIDAEYVFENVFRMLYRSLETLREQKTIDTWLVQVTKREALDYLERQSGDPAHTTAVSHDAALEADIARWQTHHIARQAIAQLDRQCGTMLDALLGEPPLSQEELAVKLGLPIAGIPSTRSRCLNRLKALLSEAGIDLLRDSASAGPPP